ncbi:putative membrane protein [Cocos nucifera]|uniref:Putative membrane protein n=1 Tax=Cocos nucifera TaxID=13894 RepID=A0A8K0INA1_COCNU|nr:putative membrane protein [Cocos nucifera]
MNDLSGTATGRRCLAPVPAAVPCVIVPLLLAGLAVFLLILVVVHNALLAAVLLLSAVSAFFLLWNAASFRNHGALLVFLDRLPASDLVTAMDGQLVKITGVI